jgi:hypothetical protein
METDDCAVAVAAGNVMMDELADPPRRVVDTVAVLFETNNGLFVCRDTLALANEMLSH